MITHGVPPIPAENDAEYIYIFAETKPDISLA